jgi:ParB-like chromosome segregation protein Spo0J
MRGNTRRAPAADRDGQIATIPIASLLESDSPRLAGENEDHIRVLAASGSTFPPLLVHKATMRVIDGMHRLRAARLRGEQTIEVEYFAGTDDEAFMAAVQANVTHGLPLTLADRESAALRILRADPRRSDRLIADTTGLAATTIAALRQRAGMPADCASARMGRDGRVRPVDIAEGRLRVQQKIASDPDASVREIARAAGVSVSTVSDVRKRMGRGLDPVPPRRRGIGRRAHGSGSGGGQAEQDPDDLIRLLKKDPALRYTSSGRQLLHCLEFQVRGPHTVQTMLAALPPHCRYLVARLIHRSCEEWRKLAVALEQRA